MNEIACRSVSRVAFALVLVLWCVAGCSATQPGEPQKAAAPAIRAGSADEILASAVVEYRKNRGMDRALVFIRAAAEKAPERTDIAWLHAQVCSAVPGCAPEPLEARLRKLDPRNSVVWIGALRRAQQQGDRAAEPQILEAMSNGAYVDVYWNQLLWKTSLALRAMPGQTKDATGAPSLTIAMDDTTFWLTAMAIPRFEPVAKACSKERLADATVAARCSRVANVLQNGDTYLAEGVGLGIAERVARPGTAEALAVAERISTSRYQRETASRVISVQIEKEKFSAELIELTQRLRREQDVFLAVVRWAGEPLLPPNF
jgi:hypothetical protein